MASLYNQFSSQRSMVEYAEEVKKEIQKSQNMKYKVFNIKDLLTEIQYEGVRKGTKNETYLENVIQSINATKKYRWVQFFQLVDVFYVVVDVLVSQSKSKNSQEEIKDHYKNVEPEHREVSKPSSKSETRISETYANDEPVVVQKVSFPWKK